MHKIIFAAVLVLMAMSLAFGQKNEIEFNDGSQIDLFTGRTEVELSADFVGALGSLQIAPNSVFPARLKRGTVTFPITDATLETATLKGEIIHSGGLTLTKKGTVVKLKSFIIDTTGESIILTGLVSANGQVVGRIPLFDLQLTSNLGPISIFRSVSLSNVLVTLRPEAAEALNAVFETEAFVAGFDIGVANVRGFGFRG